MRRFAIKSGPWCAMEPVCRQPQLSNPLGRTTEEVKVDAHVNLGPLQAMEGVNHRGAKYERKARLDGRSRGGED